MQKDNNTRYIILGLLSHQQMSGYDLKKRIDLTISQFWPVGYAQIYPTLSGLEQEGLVTRKAEESDKGPPKNVYSITAAGKRQLDDWLAAPGEKEYVRYEILLKLFFGAGIGWEENIERIEAFQKRQEINLSLIRRFRTELEGIQAESDDHFCFLLTVLFGEEIYNAYLNWSQKALALLQEKNRKI